MSIKIESNIIALQQINLSLYSKQNVSFENTLEKTFCTINKLLREIEINVKDGFTPLTEILRPEIIEVLHCLHKIMDDNSNIELEKIQQIKTKILNVQTAVKTAPLHNKKEVLPIEIKPLAFFCDLESKDHNGAVWMKLKQAFEQGIPFVTTRSLFRGTGYKDQNIRETAQFFIENEKYLLSEQSNYDIFLKGEMLVVMPRSYLPEKTTQEKLASLDFKIDGSLQLISMHEALQGPQGKCNIEAFFDLFVVEPKTYKLFDFTGHGFINMIGALKAEQYRKFLNFLEDHCKGLVISSCFSAGQSSLLNLPDQAKGMNFFDQNKPHLFPTLVRSLGDFSSKMQQEDLKAFLDEFASFAGSSEGQTYTHLRRRIEKLKDSKDLTAINLLQFYPAHGAGSPIAFRALGEGSKGFAITYALVKRAEIRSRKPFNTKEESNAIIVKDAELLEVYPLVTSVPIQCINRNPILLSKAPGKGHHFIKEIHLAEHVNETPLNFLKSTIKFYKEKGLGEDIRYDQASVDKSFFIGSIKGSQQELKGVVLYISPKISAITYADENGHFVTMDVGETLNEITPLDYAIYNSKMALFTLGEEKAIRAISAGQECEEIFWDAIIDAKFLPDPFFKLFKIKNNTVECVAQFMELIQEMSLEDKSNAFLYLLSINHPDIAFKLFKQELFDCELFNFSFLIREAVVAGAIELVQCLLEKKVGLKETYEDGKTTSHIAVKHLKDAYTQQEKGVAGADKMVEKREIILDLLLAQPNIDIEVKDKNGWTLFVEALPNRKIVKKLMDKGAKLFPCLGMFIAKQDFQSVDLLLELGADPNGFQAVKNAIYLNDLDLVKRLLLAGAKVGPEELKEAIYRASPAMVELLIESKNCQLESNDKYSITPMFAALITDNDEKIRMLKAKNAPMQEQFNVNNWEKSIVFPLFERFLSRNDKKGLAELLQYNLNFTKLLIKYLSEKNVSLLKEFIFEDKIDINNVAFSWYASILQLILNITSDQEVIKLCFDKVTDFSKTDFFNALIEYGNNLESVKSAVENKGANVHGKSGAGKTLPLQSTNLDTESGQQIFKWLVEQKADLNAAGKSNTTPFCHAIASGNFELVRYCVSKGAKIVLEDSNLVSPLAFAASIQKKNSGDIFKYLFLEAKGDINAPGITPAVTLFAALASSGNLEHIEWALEQGAEVNPILSQGQESPINLAAERKDDPELKIFRRLIKAGAELDDLSGRVLITLMRRGDKKLVEYCYEHGAQQQIYENIYYSIVNSIASKNAEMLQFLVDKYQMKGWLSYDKYWLGQMAEIAAEGNLAMMKIILARSPQGLNVSPRECTFFECAIKAQPRPQIEIISLLLDHKDDPRQKIDGAPAIYYAVSRGEPELVKILLEKGAGADINVINVKTGQTALELAKVQGNSLIIDLLQKQ